MMGYDYSKLLGRIKEFFGGQRNFADAMELSENTISKKLSGKTHWKDKEISKALYLLDISLEDVHKYFFKSKVQMFEQTKEPA